MAKKYLYKLLLVISGIYCLYMGYQYTYPLYESISNPPEPKYISIAAVIIQTDDLISNGMEFISMLTLGLFLISILVSFLLEPIQASNMPRKNGATIAIALGIIVSIVGIIGSLVYIDPRGYYETGHYAPRISQSRRLKLEVYADYPQQPDLVILGSSHAALADADQINELTGMDTFNASVEGGSAVYHLPMVKYIYAEGNDSLPPVLMIEIFSPLGTQLELKYAPNKLIPYLDFKNMRLAIEEKGTALFNLQHLSEAIYVYYSQTNFDPPPPESNIYLENGTNRFNTVTRPPEILDQLIDQNIQSYFPGICPDDKLIPTGQAAIEEIVQIANENNTAVIFYRTPFHPRYYEARVAHSMPVLKCNEIFDAFFENLSAENPNIFYLNYISVDSFNGFTDNQGFLDAHHMTRKNNELLFADALPTIQEAYAWAQDARRN